MHNKWKIMFSGLWFLSIVSLSNSIVLQTAKMKYNITQTFKSECPNGMLTTDNVTLDIKVTDIKQAPTKDTSLVLELVDPVSGVTSTMCKLPFKPSCNLQIVQGCFCVPAPAKEYHFRYRSLANNDFSNGHLMVNGEMVPGVVYPTVLSVNPPVQLSINGRDSVPMDDDCTTKAPVNKNSSFTFCVSGLFFQRIRIDLGPQFLDANFRASTTRECFTGYLMVWNKTEDVTFKYFNCRQWILGRCTVQGVKEETGSEGYDKWIYLTVGGLILFSTSTLFFFYTKLRKSHAQDTELRKSHDTELRKSHAQDTEAHKSADAISSEVSMEEIESSGVDPKLPPASKPTPPRTSLGRLTERFGLKSMSITSHSPLSPK